jgi:Ca2+-transporting ATPase
LICVGLAILGIVLSTTLNAFQRLLHTAPLDAAQWMGCIGAALVIVVVSELRKRFVHQTIDEVEVA